jgi:hypothetical protein
VVKKKQYLKGEAEQEGEVVFYLCSDFLVYSFGSMDSGWML